jgi:hypothetical protein
MGQDFDMESQTEGFDGFSDKAIRRGFIKKVYTIISVQVETTICTLICPTTFLLSSFSLSGLWPPSRRVMPSGGGCYVNYRFKTTYFREWFGFETFSERGGHVRPQGITVAFWAIFAVSFISSISIIIAMACVRTLRV